MGDGRVARLTLSDGVRERDWCPVEELDAMQAERDAERERADHAERLFLTAHDMATELQCVLFGASVLPAEIHADIEAMRARVKP